MTRRGFSFTSAVSLAKLDFFNGIEHNIYNRYWEKTFWEEQMPPFWCTVKILCFFCQLVRRRWLASQDLSIYCFSPGMSYLLALNELAPLFSPTQERCKSYTALVTWTLSPRAVLNTLQRFLKWKITKQIHFRELRLIWREHLNIMMTQYFPKWWFIQHTWKEENQVQLQVNIYICLRLCSIDYA